MPDRLDKINLIRVPSVNPGFGGQGLIPRRIDEVAALRQLGGDPDRDLRWG